MNISVDPDRGCQHPLVKSKDFGSEKLTQTFIKTRYSNANSGVTTDFNK